MAEQAAYIIDANVWIMADKLISADQTIAEQECIKACLDWLLNFAESNAYLVVDDTYKILKEYRDNIREGGVVERLLNQIESQALNRMKRITITFDENGIADVPDVLKGINFDPNDRKFVAASLAHSPHPPIVNAVDTDWIEAGAAIESLGLVVHELCDARLEEILSQNMK